MNFVELRNNHTTTMKHLTAIDIFLNDHYVRNERVTIESLRVKLKVKTDKVIELIQKWIDCVNQPNVSHRLCVFYSEDHAKPYWFNKLSLPNTLPMQLVAASRQMHLTTKRHNQLLREFVSASPTLVMQAVDEINTSYKKVLMCLRKHGFIEGDVIYTKATEQDIYPQFGYSGNNRRRVDDFEKVQAHWGFGVRDFDCTDKLLANPNLADDFIILRDKKAGVMDDPEKRKVMTRRLREFINSVIAEDLLFVEVRNSNFISDRLPSLAKITLVLGNKNELGINVTVTFTQLVGVGRAIIDK